MNILFVFSNVNDEYQNELNIAYQKLQGKKKNLLHQIFSHELTIEYLKKHHISLVITGNLSEQWIYILRGMRIVSLVFGDAQEYHHKADIVIDFKGTDSVKYFSGHSYSLSNPDFDFEEVSNLVCILKWDSDFFGFPIALIGSRYLTDNIQHHIEYFIKENNIRLLQYLCNCHDDRSVKVAERNNFHFTDIRLTFNISLKEPYQIDDLPYQLGVASPENIEYLKELTNFLYKDSRYFYDGNFELNKINEFYASWIEKAILGTFDDCCFCLYENGLPIGFCTVKYSKAASANIGLFGMDQRYAGKGLGKLLILNVFNELIKKGIKNVNVVTQGRNYVAQRLYQSVGFKTLSTQLWYHKWI
ncbi:GNAT family N-acetyltransferase [Asinibacterium sp. OR53]|uniref:GNAT family N-acetyltransferase n=1 Tax=Asinibacterium sp. OR53 TaxID=925409 RepID=UPI000479DEC2|nr:GNAT family N-acetyltransferase [Asinibacterium sp. OR53]